MKLNDQVEHALRAIGDAHGREALTKAAQDIFFATAGLIATVAGVGHLQRCLNSLPQVLERADIAPAEELSAPAAVRMN
jgi:hypothetical protein